MPIYLSSAVFISSLVVGGSISKREMDWN